MKKLIVGLVLLACAVLPILAGQCDNEPFSVQAIGTTTNTRSIVVRGELEAIKVDVTAGQTCDVSVATAELTLFSKTDIAADATFLPRAATHTTAGVAATFVGGTNDTANTWYSKMPMAGAVTVTVIGKSAGTNNTVTTILYSR
jgi:hypothetical protein